MYLIFIISLFLFTVNSQPPPLKFTLSNASRVEDFSPYKGYWPDGGISVIKDSTNNQYLAFWSEFESFRTVTDTVDLRNHVGKLNPLQKVIGGRRNGDGSGKK